MMKLKILLTFFLLGLSDVLLACPACAGSLSNPRDKYMVYVLGIFVLFTYIPMYYLYRMIKKHNKTNQALTSGAQDDQQ